MARTPTSTNEAPFATSPPCASQAYQPLPVCASRRASRAGCSAARRVRCAMSLPFVVVMSSPRLRPTGTTAVHGQAIRRPREAEPSVVVGASARALGLVDVGHVRIDVVGPTERVLRRGALAPRSLGLLLRRGLALPGSCHPPLGLLPELAGLGAALFEPSLFPLAADAEQEHGEHDHRCDRDQDPGPGRHAVALCPG